MTRTLGNRQSGFIRRLSRTILLSVRGCISGLAHGSKGLPSCSFGGFGWTSTDSWLCAWTGVATRPGRLSIFSMTFPRLHLTERTPSRITRMAFVSCDDDTNQMFRYSRPTLNLIAVPVTSNCRIPTLSCSARLARSSRFPDRAAAPHRTALFRTKTPSRFPEARSIRSGSEWALPAFTHRLLRSGRQRVFCLTCGTPWIRFARSSQMK